MRMNFSLDDLATFIENSSSLQELDLSQNDFVPLHFAPLLKTLAYNKVIRNINLSWNKLIEKDRVQGNKPVFFDTRKLNQMVTEGLVDKYITLPNFNHFSQMNMPGLLVESISRILRYNQNIQCINLESTGLTSQVLVDFVPALRHAKSLICFHLD